MKRSLNGLNRGSSKGLSLIEVIVALVVISGFGAALFVWAGQTLQTASRAADVQQQAELERNITELAYSLNPMQTPNGQMQTATHRYRWQASAEVGPTDQVAALAGISSWQVGLYKVRITVTDLESPQTALVGERLVTGFRQVRARQTGPPGFAAPIAAPTASPIASPSPPP